MPNSVARSAVVALVCLLASPWSTSQSQNKGFIVAAFDVQDPSIRGRPVMISVISNGAMIDQQEQTPPLGQSFSGLTPGLYDVRVEGEGMTTEVKRGVHVFSGKYLNLKFVLKPGKGLHVVEFAQGALSREEVAHRLQRLEGSVSETQKAIADLKKPPPPYPNP